jgi:hypothetical protein
MLPKCAAMDITLVFIEQIMIARKPEELLKGSS